MTQNTEVQFDFCKISIIDSQIIHTEFYSNDNFSLSQAKQLDAARYKLVNGKPFYSLVSMISVFGHMTKEAQQFFASEALCKDLVFHEIILVDSLSIRILAKSYIKWIKPSYTIQIKKRYEIGLSSLKEMRDSS